MHVHQWWTCKKIKEIHVITLLKPTFSAANKASWTASPSPRNSAPRFTAAIVKRWQELEQHNSRDNSAELAALRAENRRLYWLVDELQDAYTKTHGDALKLLRYRRLGLSSRECAQLLGCSVRSIGRRLARLKQLGFGEQQALPLAAPQGSRLRFADGEV